jgi:hypothetical protein
MNFKKWVEFVLSTRVCGTVIGCRQIGMNGNEKVLPKVREEDASKYRDWYRSVQVWIQEEGCAVARRCPLERAGGFGGCMKSEKIDKVVDIAGAIAGKAEEIDDILVLYCTKDGKTGSLDNGLMVSMGLLMVEQFKLWMLTGHAKLHDKD